MHLRGYLSGTTLFGWDGTTKTQLTSAGAVQAALSAGKQIMDASGFVFDNGINPGSYVSTGGDVLLKGCPLSTFFGAPLTLAQAQLVMGAAPILQSRGYTTCLAQAQAMIQGSQPATSGTPVSNVTITTPNIHDDFIPYPYPVEVPPMPVPPVAAPDNTLLYVGLGVLGLIFLGRRKKEAA